MNNTVKDKKINSRLKTVLFLVFAWILIFALLGGMTWFTNKWIVRLTPYHRELRGIDRWNSSDFFANEEYAETADEEYAEAADEEAFLSSYPPRDCDYYYDYYERALQINDVTRELAFLTYDDPAVYAAAKQSRLDYIAGQSKTPAETEAFGFAFCSFDDIMKVTKGRGKNKHIDYEAFGYNDEAMTLVFLQFDASGSREKKYMKLANTNYEAFLSHYYCKWFDWENSIGIHLPE